MLRGCRVCMCICECMFARLLQPGALGAGLDLSSQLLPQGCASPAHPGSHRQWLQWRAQPSSEVDATPVWQETAGQMRPTAPGVWTLCSYVFQVFRIKLK